MEGKLRPDFKGEELTVLEEEEEEVEEEVGTWGSLGEDSTFQWTFSRPFSGPLTAGIGLRGREINSLILYQWWVCLRLHLLCYARMGCLSQQIYTLNSLTFHQNTHTHLSSCGTL